MKIRVGQHVRVLPCSSVAITRRFANAANKRNNTILNNQKEPTLFVSWLFAFRGFLNS